MADVDLRVLELIRFHMLVDEIHRTGDATLIHKASQALHSLLDDYDGDHVLMAVKKRLKE